MSLIVQPARSTCLALFLALTHAIAAVAPWLTSLGLAAKVLLSVLAMLFFLRSHARLVRLECPDCLRSARLDDRAQWHLGDRQGERLLASQCRASMMLPWVMVLEFDLADGGTRAWLICRDALPADQFRRLAVHLRMRSGK